MATDPTIAHTILAQLGGSKFLAMTGARDLTSRPDGLTMRVPGCMDRAGRSFNVVRVTLTAMDDYQLEGISVRGTKVVPVAFSEGIYAENLRETFENFAHLRTGI